MHIQIETGSYKAKWTVKFLSLMINRLHMGSYRYKDKHRDGTLVSHLENIKRMRRALDNYQEHGNTDALIRLANFALLEFDSENRPPAPHDRSL